MITSRLLKMSNEADTCRKYVLPKLVEAGWDNEPHRINEQITFTDGRIVLAGNKVRRRPQKRADFLLRYTPIESPFQLQSLKSRLQANKTIYNSIRK
jgi:type I restriction enzyme R subunit